MSQNWFNTWRGPFVEWCSIAFLGWTLQPLWCLQCCKLSTRLPRPSYSAGILIQTYIQLCWWILFIRSAPIAHTCCPVIILTKGARWREFQVQGCDSQSGCYIRVAPVIQSREQFHVKMSSCLANVLHHLSSYKVLCNNQTSVWNVRAAQPAFNSKINPIMHKQHQLRSSDQIFSDIQACTISLNLPYLGTSYSQHGHNTAHTGLSSTHTDKMAAHMKQRANYRTCSTQLNRFHHTKLCCSVLVADQF